jgi:photosystem II stability/assembly factor-like uncharacterized protein
LTARRVVLVASGLVAFSGLGIGSILWFLGQKEVADAWTACGTGGREVGSIAVDESGRVFVAANEAGRGDVLFSDDRCASFTPVGLQSESVTSVSWLPRARALCAGTKEGLRCLVGGELRDVIPSAEIAFARESRDGVVAGGRGGLWFGKGDLSQFAQVLALSGAASDAAVTDWAMLVAGPALFASLDGGHTFAPLPAAGFAPRALASTAARVWAGGEATVGGWVMRSEDGGQTWAPAEFPGNAPAVLRVVSGRPDVVIAGTERGLRPGDAWVTTDAGRSWRALGCPGEEVGAIAVDDEAVYCGAKGEGGGMWKIPLAALGLGAPGNAI